MSSIDTLCLSKTGFVSKNLLLVSEIFIGERIIDNIEPECISKNTCHLMNIAIIMNSTANPKFIEEDGRTIKIEHVGNKIESALLEMAYQMGYGYERFRCGSKAKRVYSS